MSENYYRELCKKLFAMLQNIFGIVYADRKLSKQGKLDKIYEIAGKAYNMHAYETKNGLYKEA